MAPPEKAAAASAACCKQPGVHPVPYHRGVQRRTSAGCARYSTARGAAPLGGAIRVEPWSGFRNQILRRFIPCVRSAG